MNFERVLKQLLEIFDQEKSRYALVGGFAVGALGAPRATLDLDFLIQRDDLESVHRRLLGLGYNRRFSSENVSQYQSSDPEWGAVDFIHAFRKISLAMLERAVEQPVFGGARVVRVLRPEDVIGLKVQAMANNPERRFKEIADIEALAGIYRTRLDWKQLKEYYELFKLDEEFTRLRKRFEHAE